MSTSETRQKPNLLITGTPGTGKTTLCQALAEKLGFDHINCGKEILDNTLYSEYDEEFDSHILDEDKFLDHIEDRMNSENGGYIVDYHGSDFFPERWFDFVFVLRCNNTLLYDRLSARGYKDKKIQGNIECEIFGSLLEEAKDSYDKPKKALNSAYIFEEKIVYELQNETVEQMSENLELICQLVSQWKKQ
uniref:Adenylate kinase isoenzyme 6 homolog n=1 Tax=Setaria digitata TaxID=48799 RepID=A0A915PH43_9BILA